MSQNGSIVLLIILSLITRVCSERDTKLTIQGNNPPSFAMSGSGTLEFLQVIGPRPQRDVKGPTEGVYWQINGKDSSHLVNVERLSPITYGKVPSGYMQVYPEQGEAPPLVEGERYYVWVWTNNANGAAKYFVIRDGKALEVPEH